jgi:cytochrome c553
MKVLLSILLVLFLVGCVSDNQHHEIKKIENKKVYSTKVVEVIPDVKQEVVPMAIKNVTMTRLSGKDIFKSCSSCHGLNADKKALGRSQVIKGWEAKKISFALHGYKNKTYGGSMKGLMKSQVEKLSDADIEAVSTYISKL